MAQVNGVTQEQARAWLREAITGAAEHGRQHHPESPRVEDHAPAEMATEREAAVRYLHTLLHDDISETDRQRIEDEASAVLRDPTWAMDSLGFSPDPGITGLAEDSMDVVRGDIEPDGELMALIDGALGYTGAVASAIAWIWACDVVALVDAAARERK
jgi:hypothetical protein